MRDIKFRAWDKEKHKFETFYLIHAHSIITTLEIPSNGRWKNLSDFEQFTGLTDKNGREIYEGDIVADGDKILYVKYSWYLAGFVLYENKKELEGCYILRYDKSQEVIGNIHENPELLVGRRGR